MLRAVPPLRKNAVVTGGGCGYDAVLLVSFGGPEGPEEVMSFLRRVTAQRPIPAGRLAEVAAHYGHFGGVSPINAENRALLALLRDRLDLPVYWGNRNSPPFLLDALREMRADGVRRALGYVTSGYGSYPGCRQYREDIAAAQQALGAGAPEVHKLRAFYNHPLFVRPLASAVDAALSRLPAEFRRDAHLLCTAHSIPLEMARTSPYVPQVRETARLVAAATRREQRLSVAWQSRSGPSTAPWLEPDVSDALDALAAAGTRAVVVAPIGFVADHMEVVYDLDMVALPQARRRGLLVERAATAGAAQADLVAALTDERTRPGAPKPALGVRGPAHDGCPVGCCPAPGRPISVPGAGPAVR